MVSKTKPSEQRSISILLNKTTYRDWERRKWNDDIYVYDPDLNAFDETKT